MLEMLERSVPRESEEEKIPVPETKELNRKDLEGQYQQAVGKDPKFRALSTEQLLAGIADPAAETERLALLDQEEDQADRRDRK